jgi:hypothetical protein
VRLVFTRAALILLSAICLKADDLAGHYALHGEREMASDLVLKPDGTFEYMFVYGAADYWAKGAWRAQNGSVVLNSAGKDEAPFRMLRSMAAKSGAIRVWVKAPNGRPVENIHVVLRTDEGESETNTTSDGSAIFDPTHKPKSVVFRVRVYQLEAGPFELNPAHDDFYFEINGNAITQVRFEDERLTIEGKELIMRYWSQDHPMRYQRQ